MKLKRLIVLGAILLVLFAGIGITTANENTTIESLNPNAEVSSIDNSETIDLNFATPEYDENGENDEVTIIDTTEYDNYMDDGSHVLDYDSQLITCKVKDAYGYLDDAYVLMEDEKGNVYEAWWDEDDEDYWFECKLAAGEHEITVYLDDDVYVAEPLAYKVYVEKTYFAGSVSCKAYYGTTSGSLTMKATVKDIYDNREDGTVTFKVNGKSYTVKTKNGVATKTIKIKKAGTYTYKAIFKSGNYVDNGVGKGKLYVYSTSKKARTFNIKGYKIVVPVAKYKKLVNAKNTKKLTYFQFKTNKYFKQKITTYKYTAKQVKARVSIIFSYGGSTGGQYAFSNKYYISLTTPYQNPGYDYCTPWLYGAKKSRVINKLNSAKTTKW